MNRGFRGFLRKNPPRGLSLAWRAPETFGPHGLQTSTRFAPRFSPGEGVQCSYCQSVPPWLSSSCCGSGGLHGLWHAFSGAGWGSRRHQRLPPCSFVALPPLGWLFVRSLRRTCLRVSSRYAGPQSDLQNLPFSFGFQGGEAVDVWRPKVSGARHAKKGAQGVSCPGFGPFSLKSRCSSGAPHPQDPLF